MNLDELRAEYRKNKLVEDELEGSPFRQFETWFVEAREAQIPEPNAMSLATASIEGHPSVRTVLLKYFDSSGFVFYTNYDSQKSKQLDENPYAEVLFPWIILERQVRISGKVARVSHKDSVRYFASRPRGSQLGAWVSQQSSTITSRKVLMQKFEEIRQKFKNKEIPLPSFWGGYKMMPERFEFWQGRENRLHDRFVYAKSESGWKITRLAP